MTSQDEGFQATVGRGRKRPSASAFLRSCLMTQPLASSHPSCLLFPTWNCFLPSAVPGRSPQPCPPSGDTESTDLCRVQTAGRTTPAHWTLPEDADGWANGAGREILTFKPGCFIPALTPSDASSPEGTEGRGWLNGSV